MHFWPSNDPEAAAASIGEAMQKVRDGKYNRTTLDVMVHDIRSHLLQLALDARAPRLASAPSRLVPLLFKLWHEISREGDASPLWEFIIDFTEKHPVYGWLAENFRELMATPLAIKYFRELSRLGQLLNSAEFNDALRQASLRYSGEVLSFFAKSK